MRGRIHERAGFTLAELLVASTMIAIVMAAVYTTFATSIRVWRAGEAGFDRYHEARIAVGLMTRELRAISPNTLHLCEGTSDEIRFYAIVPPMNVEDGAAPRLMQIRYRLDSGPVNAPRALLREEAIVLGELPREVADPDARQIGPVELGQTYTFTIAHDVDAFSIRYYWVPPAERPADAPPEDIPLLVKDETSERVPPGIEISLALAPDDSAYADDAPLAVSSFVVFRGPVTRFPLEWIERG